MVEVSVNPIEIPVRVRDQPPNVNPVRTIVPTNGRVNAEEPTVNVSERREGEPEVALLLSYVMV